jgi:hypothetical protein
VVLILNAFIGSRYPNKGVGVAVSSVNDLVQIRVFDRRQDDVGITVTAPGFVYKGRQVAEVGAA